MNDIDDILNEVGAGPSMSIRPKPLASAAPPQEGSSYFSEEDLTDIINGNMENEAEEAVEEEETEERPMGDEAMEEEPSEEEEEGNTPLDVAEETLDEVMEEYSERVSAENEAENDKIPENSPSILIDEATSRFSGTEWYNEIRKAKVIIAGIGGIGSNTAFQLARMSPARVVLYDDDTVEMANLAGQLFNRGDVGSTKVDAMTRIIAGYTTLQEVMAVPRRFTKDDTAGDIMICGFDNMVARRTFFNSWRDHVASKPDAERKKCLLIDGRLSIDTLQVLCLTGDDEYNMQRYNREFLFKDSEADPTICSMKQTTYLACMIGSFIVNMFTNFIANQLDPVIPYDLPFFTEYDAQNVLFKTER